MLFGKDVHLFRKTCTSFFVFFFCFYGTEKRKCLKYFFFLFVFLIRGPVFTFDF